MEREDVNVGTATRVLLECNHHGVEDVDYDVCAEMTAYLVTAAEPIGLVSDHDQAALLGRAQWRGSARRDHEPGQQKPSTPVEMTGRT